MAVSDDSGQGAAVRPLATVPDPGDRLLGGLLSPDFDDKRSCLSRHSAARYRRPSTHALSSHLVSALRRYESLHRRCGPGTPAYTRAVERLRAPATNASFSDAEECSYLVWTPTAGLGNQILSLASAFLYALLTDRALLLHRAGDDLFCEPFPGSTWLLPSNDDGFPIRDIKHLTIGSPESLGSVLSRGGGGSSPPWLYVHLRHDYKFHDRLFFCDDVQAGLLRRVPWLVAMADNYFAPGLFLVPRFEAQLARMFPRREAVFHHLGRYLFHPTNTVWAMVTRYHTSSSFTKGDAERVGVQVRMFKWAPISVDELYAQILSCVHRENILPAGISADPAAAKANTTTRTPPAKRKAVVFASLYSEFSEKLRDLYTERGGEVISVFQPTHLGAQHFGDRAQNQAAFAEMVLLSFADVAVTTAASTFGYVIQGLAGRRPWVLARPDHGKAPPGLACRLAPSVEPCFHAPPNYDCGAKARGDTGKTVRYIRHCEDFPQGVQLVE